MNWEAQYLPPGMATKPWHSGWRLHKCSGKLGRTFSQSLHIPKSVRAMYDSPLQNAISPALPMLLPNCSSLSPDHKGPGIGAESCPPLPRRPPESTSVFSQGLCLSFPIPHLHRPKRTYQSTTQAGSLWNSWGKKTPPWCREHSQGLGAPHPWPACSLERGSPIFPAGRPAGSHITT